MTKKKEEIMAKRQGWDAEAVRRERNTEEGRARQADERKNANAYFRQRQREEPHDPKKETIAPVGKVEMGKSGVVEVAVVTYPGRADRVQVLRTFDKDGEKIVTGSLGKMFAKETEKLAELLVTATAMIAAKRN